MSKQSGEMSIVASVLDRLLDDDPRAGDPRMDTLEIKNPGALARKLKAEQHPLVRFLFDSFPRDARAVIDKYGGDDPAPHEVEVALVDGLNAAITGSFLYERQRFAGIKLSAETLRVVEDSRTSPNVAYLNRVLLDETFPDDIKKMPKPQAPSMTFRELKRAVSRDIEYLLNTRRELLEEVNPSYKEVGNSVLMYGLPDFTSYSLMNTQHRKVIRRAVEDTLTKFEPRLKSVRVSMEPQAKFDPTLRFRIDALLRLETATEPVTFDASLQLTTSQYSVRGDA